MVMGQRCDSLLFHYNVMITGKLFTHAPVTGNITWYQSDGNDALWLGRKLQKAITAAINIQTHQKIAILRSTIFTHF